MPEIPPPRPNTLAERLATQEEDNRVASAAITDALVQAARDKREAQLSGDAVPADKTTL